MALIKCPECGKEVSNRTKQCIHCGCPLDEQEIILYDVLYMGYNDDKTKYANQVNLVGSIRQLCNLDLSHAKKLIDNPPQVVMKALTKENAEWVIAVLQPFKCNVEIVETNEPKEIKDNIKVNAYNIAGGNTIVCPHCGSNQVTTGARGFSLMTGFFGSNRTVNRCGKCGWTWSPK